MDYFALLPPEIIQRIFNNLTPDDEGLRSPLSKSLLPFQHRRLFRNVLLRSYKSLSQACETAQRPQSAFLHTESIDVRILKWRGSSASYDEFDDTFAPTDGEIWRFFRTLVHVKELTIISPRLPSLILAPDFAHSIFPNLTDLYLSSSFSEFDDPFDPSHYTSLSRYPNLHTLHLLVDRDSSNISPLSHPRPPFPSISSKLVDITLDGPLSACQASVTQLIDSFDSIESIELSDAFDPSRLYDLISGLGVHPQLWAIRFDRCVAHEHPPRGNIVDVLLGFSRQFPNLRYLRIGGECDLSLPSFYDFLRTSCLRDLDFTKGTNPSLKELAKLVENGGTKHKLRTIRFGNTQGERGTRIEDIGRPYDDDEIDAWNVYPDWVLPRWNEGFREADLVEFIEIAKRKGIEVTGTAVEAIGIDREFELEHQKLDEYNYRREVITS